MFKKALSLLLSMMLVVTSLVVTVVSVNAAGDTYLVAGSEDLTGYTWVGVAANAPENVMTENGDGNYEKVFTDVAVGNGYQFKIVKNDTEWFGIGDTGNDNFTFNVTKKCDVTVTYNPTTNEITATGDGVVIPTDLDIDYITAVGNGADAWLNDKNWTVNADENIMAETSEGSKVYQIKFEGLDAYENYQFKFAANGSWTDNWGLPEQGNAPLNEWFDLTYNGQNMIIDTDAAGYEDGYDIVLTLDLSGFNYSTKQGAKGKVDIITDEEPTEPATEEPTTVAPATEPATEAPTTEAATTVAPAKGLAVTATSNLFPEKKVTLSPDQKTVKVTYVLQTQDKDILDFQWFMNYDANVLQPTSNTKKSTSFEYPSQGSYIFSKDTVGEVGANGTNLGLYDSTSKEIVLASAEFKVIDPTAVETKIDLDVQVLRVSKVDPDTELTITEEESEITNFGLNQANYDKYVKVCKTVTDPDQSYEPTEPATEAPTTAEATTVAPTTVAPTTEEATTVAPTTVAPTTEEPTTVAPTTAAPAKGLTVTATSNLFPEKKVTLSPDQKTIKVTYVFQSKDKDMLDFQWFMNYDANVLEPTKDTTTKSTSFEYPNQGSYIYNKAIPGEIGANGTNLGLYDTSSKEIVFASAEFKVIDPSATETTIDLDVQVLRLSNVDPDTELTITEEEVEVMNFGLNQENYDKYVSVCKTVTVPDGSEEPTVAPTTEEATTVAPTTVAPTTAAPTEEPTEVPTTEPATEVPTTAPVTEPTTVAPTTEPTTEPVPEEPVYVVAGSEDFAGVAWVGDPTLAPENVMTKDGEVFTKTFPATKAGNSYQLKVVKNNPDGSQNWIGYENTDNNLTFNVTADCDVTVTYNPATNEINVTGEYVDIVKDLDIEYVVAVGNGYENWLNDVNWGVASDKNMMDQVADKVYKITYTDVASSDSYQFKFAANGSWAANWGLPEQAVAPVGENFDLIFNGQNMVLDTVALGYEEDTPVDVTLTLDLSNFNYIAGTGAKAFVQVTPKTPSDEATITASSNICQANGTGTYKVGDKVSVYYVLDTKDAQLEEVQWNLEYDKDALELNSLTMPAIDDAMINVNDAKGLASNLALYDFAGGKKLVEATFTVKAAGETNVNLNVVDLTLGKRNADTGLVDEDTEYEAVVGGNIADDIFDNINTEAKVEAVVEPTTEPTTEAPTTEPTTTEPVTEPTTEPTTAPTTEPTTTEPATEAPTEAPTVTPTTEAPTTEAPTTEPATEAPTEAPTVAPTTEAPTTEPTTEAPTTVPAEPTTVAPVTEPTTTEPVASEPDTTVEPATVGPTTPDATSSTEQPTTKGQSTSDTSTSDTPGGNNNGNSPVQTGNASMAIVILLALVSATGVVYFTRKRFTK